MLRNQIPEQEASYDDPARGVNLRASLVSLQPGESPLMQNCILDGGIRIRTGNSRLTPTALASSLGVRGGTKFYYGGASSQKVRLIAYGTKIVTVADVGTETVLTSAMSNDKDTWFTTWSITDKVYISNSTDTLRSYDGATFATVTGTAIPIPRGPVVGVQDRLLAITVNGVERTNPRNDSVWSTNSGWATFRPITPGLFTALHPVTIRGTDTFHSGALVFQQSAHYLITGSNFGADVTLATPSTGEDSAIRYLGPVGTLSPYSVETIPGVGTFWFTHDINVYFLPEGSLSGRYIGDKLISNGSTLGIESVNKAALSQVWMRSFSLRNRYLILALPMGSDTYASTQFWLDLRTFVEQPNLGPVWYGPMTGQTIGRMWREDQQGELQLVGGEGNPTTGIFVYRAFEPSLFTDAIGLTNTAIPMVYQTSFKDGGAPRREKYVRAVNLDMNTFSGSPTVDIVDLNGNIATGLAIQAV